ncbi:Hypothetical predicted protein [Marmota monax]|uniref:Uncharacterized protein n=1 Tax=Marmota monax TaxID=9995 RepID=A0A5E4A6H2_MARMO|nr:hypothetical protein GHT09_020033 [Marmota monax]VTJ52857.1 Hypothetical predicted protein [Marmota monax]
MLELVGLTPRYAGLFCAVCSYFMALLLQPGLVPSSLLPLPYFLSPGILPAMLVLEGGSASPAWEPPPPPTVHPLPLSMALIVLVHVSCGCTEGCDLLQLPEALAG